MKLNLNIYDDNSIGTIHSITVDVGNIFDKLTLEDIRVSVDKLANFCKEHLREIMNS